MTPGKVPSVKTVTAEIRNCAKVTSYYVKSIKMNASEKTITPESCNEDKSNISGPVSVTKTIEELLEISDVTPGAILKAITFLLNMYDSLIAKIKKRDIEINNLTHRVGELEKSQSAVDTGIPIMASKLELLDQENRKKNVLSGLNLKSFSSAVKGDTHDDPQSAESASMLDRIVEFAGNNNITIDKNDIESAIPLHSRLNSNGPQRTLIRFRNHTTQQRFY